MSAEDVARALVVAFARGWTVRAVAENCGCEVTDSEAIARLHGKYPFMPPNFTAYFRDGQQVRAFVTAEWPKLAEYLDRYGKDEDRIARVIPQVTRLVAHGKKMPRKSKADVAEFRKSRHEIRIATTTYAVERAQQLSNQRGAWNVCKR